MNYFLCKLEEVNNKENIFSDFLTESIVKSIYQSGFKNKIKKDEKEFNFIGCFKHPFTKEQMERYKQSSD